MQKNKDSTRYCSRIQENRVAKKFGGHVNSNSGAGKFYKSDVVLDDIGVSIECKTSMTDRKSFSIKKEWIEKHNEEAFSNRMSNCVIAFNFWYEDKNDYYVIDDKLMRYLVDSLRRDNLDS